jgi:chemotaxis protein methyltransferase CheR
LSQQTLDSLRRSSPTLTPAEFGWIKDYMYNHAGIVLNNKQALIEGRLNKRLQHYGLSNYSDYFRMLNKPGHELETVLAVDLLTTNETYFFREHKHFEFLVREVLKKLDNHKPLRVWSAASSSGEEAYSIAMTIAEQERFSDWRIVGSDLSMRILEKAQRGVYALNSSEKIPAHLLKKYCLRGKGDLDGVLMIDPVIRRHVEFRQVNLTKQLPELGSFDVIFLRNVMIYFDSDTKQHVVNNVAQFLKPGGYFMISHSESLNGIKHELNMVLPSIYP